MLVPSSSDRAIWVNPIGWADDHAWRVTGGTSGEENKMARAATRNTTTTRAMVPSFKMSYRRWGP
ncbi:MAG: hypothetical protein ACYCZP_07785, partial [Acidimicrobiales bacterium]